MLIEEAYPSHFMCELKELIYSDEKEHWPTIHIVSVASNTNKYVDITTFLWLLWFYLHFYIL